MKKELLKPNENSFYDISERFQFETPVAIEQLHTHLIESLNSIGAKAYTSPNGDIEFQVSFWRTGAKGHILQGISFGQVQLNFDYSTKKYRANYQLSTAATRIFCIVFALVPIISIPLLALYPDYTLMETISIGCSGVPITIIMSGIGYFVGRASSSSRFRSYIQDAIRNAS